LRDRAGVERLIRQLDDPQFQKREQAAEELRKLGPPVIPALEKAAETASFEARAQITEVIRSLRVRGAMVLATIVDSPGALLGIEPGDVITSVNGISVDSYEDFFEKAVPLEKGGRKFKIRTGPRPARPHLVKKSKLPAERTIEAGPGKLGMFLGDYDGKYGDPLAMAMQDFDRCGLESRWAEARKNIEEALASGLAFDDDSMLEPMYAAACYYSGDKSTAHERFDAYVRRNEGGNGWWSLMGGLDHAVTCKGHLHLHFARRQLRDHPQDVNAALEIARTLSWSQARYLEAASVALAALNGQPARPDEACRGVGLNALQNALDAMDLVPEAGEVADQLGLIEEARVQWGYAFRTAERSGDYDLALKLGRGAYQQPTAWNALDSQMAERVLRLCLRQDLLKDARRLLAEYKDPGSMPHLLWGLRNCDLAWSQSQLALAKFARRSVADARFDRDILVSAFLILSRLTTPDLEELEELTAAKLQENTRTYGDGERTEYHQYLPAMLALVKEEYEEAARHAGADKSKDALPASFRKAIEFLCQHGAGLTDDKAIWKRTSRAFNRPAGGCYLLTRDQHIGWSDGPNAREIPLPEPVWSFDEPNCAFLVSGTGKAVLTVGLGRVYRLRADESGWELLCSMPARAERFFWAGLEPALDDLVAAIEEGGKRRDLVWPDKRPEYRYDDRPEFLMLSDGTWLGYDPRAKRVLRVSQQLGDMLKTPVDIYAIRAAGSKGERLWVFTSEGLLEWRPQSGQVTRVSLPGTEKPGRVMDATGQYLPGGGIRVALFPEEGGTTFLLNESTGKITLEGLVNEAYPETYWRQQPTASKREQFMQAIAKAGLTWPPPVGTATRQTD
jgi:hypothetical protein